MPETVLSRRQLYDFVWSRPEADLALQLGISPRSLKALCERHRIPIPRSSYWAKVKLGRTPRRTIFVEIDDDQTLNSVTIGGSHKADPAVGKGSDPQSRRPKQQPTQRFRFQVEDWGQMYSLASDDLDGDDQDDQFAEANKSEERATEILDLSGTLRTPVTLKGQKIRLSLWVGETSGDWQFGDVGYGWIGWLNLDERPIDAETSIGQFAAIRLTTLLSVQKRLLVTLSVARDDQPRRGIVGFRFETS